MLAAMVVVTETRNVAKEDVHFLQDNQRIAVKRSVATQNSEDEGVAKAAEERPNLRGILEGTEDDFMESHNDKAENGLSESYESVGWFDVEEEERPCLRGLLESSEEQKKPNLRIGLLDSSEEEDKRPVFRFGDQDVLSARRIRSAHNKRPVFRFGREEDEGIPGGEGEGERMEAVLLRRSSEEQ